MKTQYIKRFLGKVVEVFWIDESPSSIGRLVENKPKEYHTTPAKFMLVDPCIPESAYGVTNGQILFGAIHVKKIRFVEWKPNKYDEEMELL